MITALPQLISYLASNQVRYAFALYMVYVCM